MLTDRSLWSTSPLADPERLAEDRCICVSYLWLFPCSLLLVQYAGVLQGLLTFPCGWRILWFTPFLCDPHRGHCWMSHASFGYAKRKR